MVRLGRSIGWMCSIHNANWTILSVFLFVSVCKLALIVSASGDKSIADLNSLFSNILSFSPDDSDQCFPEEFLFGTATSAYQVEGGWNLTSREPCVWDSFCKEREGVECGYVAADMIHKFRSDILLMKQMGLNSYRFSISWSRLMNWDVDTLHMVPNKKGIEFYHSLISVLLENNITPVLTLYHFDLPTVFEQYLLPPGWLNPAMANHFEEYASLVFHEYGKLVPFFATFNEPLSFINAGYSDGVFPPGMTGSDTLGYTAAHNVLRAHAYAVKKFRSMKETHAVKKSAQISIVLNMDQAQALDSTQDGDLVERVHQFRAGWFLQPLKDGEYPQVMKEAAGDRLPEFTSGDKELVKDSIDILMINSYSGQVVTRCDSPSSQTPCDMLPLGWPRDLGVDVSRFPPGAVRGGRGPKGYLCPWFAGVPGAYLATIRWFHYQMPSMPILLTENGFCGADQDELSDRHQLEYLRMSLEQVYTAITEDKIPILGYHVWSFLDNYEWGSYAPRFGLFRVNYCPEEEQEPHSGSLPTASHDAGGATAGNRGNLRSGCSGDTHKKRSHDHVRSPRDLMAQGAEVAALNELECLERSPRPAAYWYSKVASSSCLA